MKDKTNEILDSMCQLSEACVDEKLKPRLKALKTSDNFMEDLKQICGDIINYSLTSSFELMVLQQLYISHGGKIEDVTGQICRTPFNGL